MKVQHVPLFFASKSNIITCILTTFSSPSKIQPFWSYITMDLLHPSGIRNIFLCNSSLYLWQFHFPRSCTPSTQTSIVASLVLGTSICDPETRAISGKCNSHQIVSSECNQSIFLALSFMRYLYVIYNTSANR